MLTADSVPVGDGGSVVDLYILSAMEREFNYRCI